jgi:hypothetical protein
VFREPGREPDGGWQVFDIVRKENEFERVPLGSVGATHRLFVERVTRRLVRPGEKVEHGRRLSRLFAFSGPNARHELTAAIVDRQFHAAVDSVDYHPEWSRIEAAIRKE